MFHGRLPTLTLLRQYPVTFNFKRDRKSDRRERPRFLLGPARKYRAGILRNLDGETRSAVTTHAIVLIECIPDPSLNKYTNASPTEQGGDEELGGTEEAEQSCSCTCKNYARRKRDERGARKRDVSKRSEAEADAEPSASEPSEFLHRVFLGRRNLGTVWSS